MVVSPVSFDVEEIVSTTRSVMPVSMSRIYCATFARRRSSAMIIDAHHESHTYDAGISVKNKHEKVFSSL